MASGPEGAAEVCVCACAHTCACVCVRMHMCIWGHGHRHRYVTVCVLSASVYPSTSSAQSWQIKSVSVCATALQSQIRDIKRFLESANRDQRQFPRTNVLSNFDLCKMWAVTHVITYAWITASFQTHMYTLAPTHLPTLTERGGGKEGGRGV